MTCPFCHRDVPRLERHHSAGAANAPTLKVFACPRCHHELNIRLEDAGVLLEYKAPRDDVDRAWGIMYGAAELLVAVSDDDDEEARAVERVTLAAGRALVEISDHPLGPNPIAASRRDERRRRERERRPTRGEPTPLSWAASLSERTSAAGRAWASVLGSQLPLPDGEAGYASLLERLERYPHADELLEIPQAMIERIGAAVLEPISGADLDQLETQLKRLLGLLAGVAGAETDEEAFALADAALEGVGS